MRSWTLLRQSLCRVSIWLSPLPMTRRNGYKRSMTTPQLLLASQCLKIIFIPSFTPFTALGDSSCLLAKNRRRHKETRHKGTRNKFKRTFLLNYKIIF